MRESLFAGFRGGQFLLYGVTFLLGFLPSLQLGADEARRLPVEEYVDKMKAGWIGQMVGVGWGAPTEFRYCGRIVPEDQVPAWRPETVNQFFQDDVYVEMTFLETLEREGLDVAAKEAGIDFAASGYRLWHANNAGRENLRKGIAPPDSGHPQFNGHADDIDYQIEADFAGLISPGLPQMAIDLGEVFGRIMNYGDGLYGGQFVAGMYTEAFFDRDSMRIVKAGLRCIPEDSQYAECIRDVLEGYEAHPESWEATWERIHRKYQQNSNYRRFSCRKDDFNIDAKINGAYIVMGLLYGRGDPDQTTLIAIRCGQDSDCNPSNAAGILFTSLGAHQIPARFKESLDEKALFSHTEYTFERLMGACEKLAREAVMKEGGSIEKDAAGREVLVIPRQSPRPSPLEQCWEAGPVAGSRYTEKEMQRIKRKMLDVRSRWIEKQRTSCEAPQTVYASFSSFAPGWTLKGCGKDMSPGLLDEWQGRENVFVTHPLMQEVPCVLSKKIKVQEGKENRRSLVVGHHPKGNWDLVIRVNSREILRKTVGRNSAKDGWMTLEVDLSNYAGQTVSLELLNQPTGWRWEAAYWTQLPW